MPADFAHESVLWEQGIALVAGVDEAGRGPLAGPVVAAAVVFLSRSCHLSARVDDSKRLPVRHRNDAFRELTEHPSILWAIGVVSPEDIDRINILKATHAAMRLALLALKVQASHALVDGLPVQNLPCPHTSIVEGDSLSRSIAAASIVAKVTRDRLMTEYHLQFPQYGFDRHFGYATPEHLAMIRTHGPCPIHRRSFAPVAQQDFGF